MKYAHYSKTNGKILGWYDSKLHKQIPVPSIKVTEEVWQEAINNNHNYIDENGNTSFKDFRTQIQIKQDKKQVLKKAKETYLAKPININGKLFFASEEAYAKYKIAYDLGVKKGLTEGEVILLVDNNPAWVTVTKEEMENYFEAFELQGYKAERKLGYYLEALQQAKTEEEINAIVWEDVRDE